MKIPLKFHLYLHLIILTFANEDPAPSSNDISSMQTKTVYFSNDTAQPPASNITELVQTVKILVEFTSENYIDNLEQLERAFTEVQEILDYHNFRIDELIDETGRELKVAVNESENHKLTSLLNMAIGFFATLPSVFTPRIRMTSRETNCKGLLHRMKLFEDLLTALTHLRVEVDEHLSSLSTYLVDLRTAAILDSEEMTENFGEIVEIFDALKVEGESFEIDLSVAIGLLKIVVTKDDDLLRLADCLEGLPCGSFLRYDAINDPKAPHRNGFSAGKYEDSSEAYIGTGYTYFTNRNHIYYRTPGRINIDSPTPGIYMEGYGEIFHNSSVKYLLNSPHLKWENFTWTENCKFPATAVLVKNPDISYGIGRCSKSGFTSVGKAMSEWGFFYAYKGHPVNETNFEILVCDEN